MERTNILPSRLTIRNRWLLPKTKHIRYPDEKKIADDERLDRYYLIETNVVGTSEDEKPWNGTARFRNYDCLFELNRVVTDHDIVEMYRGLWKIEESFKLTKTHLQARPVFVKKLSKHPSPLSHLLRYAAHHSNSGTKEAEQRDALFRS